MGGKGLSKAAFGAFLLPCLGSPEPREPSIHRTQELQGPDSAENVQEVIGLLKEGPEDMFFKEKLENSLGRIHKSVIHIRELQGCGSCEQLLTVSSVNAVTVFRPYGLKLSFLASDAIAPTTTTDGHLAMSVDILGCHNLGGWSGDCYWHLLRRGHGCG